MNEKRRTSDEKSLGELIHFLETKLPSGNWAKALRSKASRKHLLEMTRKILKKLEVLAVKRFPVTQPARGIRFLPMSGGDQNFLNYARSFSFVWINGVDGSGFFLLGGDYHGRVFEPGVYYAYQGCPDRFQVGEFLDYPDFLLRVWIEAGEMLLRSQSKKETRN